MTVHEGLRIVCLQLAKRTMWMNRPIDNDEIERAAEQFFHEAKTFVEEVSERGDDGAFVVDAVRYLANSHALPSIRDSIQWFRDMLAVLVELFSPNSPPSASDKEFYRALLKALADSL